MAASHLGNLLKIQIFDSYYKDLDFDNQPGLEMNSLDYLEESEAIFFYWVKFT